MTRSPARPLTLAALATALLVYGMNACGPEPVGVDDCRTIEYARCDAAVACGSVEDAETCRRFYRDHCLHGFAAPETPGGAVLDRCIRAIQLAGECAQDAADQSLASCLDGKTTITLINGADIETVCDMVRQPEQTEQCQFLSNQPEQSAGGAAGQSSE